MGRKDGAKERILRGIFYLRKRGRKKKVKVAAREKGCKPVASSSLFLFPRYPVPEREVSGILEERKSEGGRDVTCVLVASLSGHKFSSLKDSRHWRPIGFKGKRLIDTYHRYKWKPV